MAKLSIIIPAYNEERTISQVLDKIKQISLLDDTTKEIIIVNDASVDQTDSMVKRFIELNPTVAINYHLQPRNMGKGSALHKGIEIATGDYLIIQDADLEYDPAEYNLLLRPLLDGMADVVFGSRFMGGNPHRILFFWHSIGNKILTFISNVFSNLNLTDMETCYKCFRSEFIKKIHLKETRFGFEPEVTAKIARFKNIRIYEVGISYYGRTYAEGKKINWKDGVRAIYCMVKYRFFDREYLKK